MIAPFLPLLAVMLLTDPSDVIDAAAIAAAREKAQADGVAAAKNPAESAHITCRTSDFDRMAGVVMLEGDVVVRYSGNYTMCSDRIFMFLSGSNEVSRVVALGNVSITNDLRVGTCAMATYRRRKGEVEMYGDSSGTLARLVEGGDDPSELEGSRIRFWLDAEQVEVDNSRITVEEKGEGALPR